MKIQGIIRLYCMSNIKTAIGYDCHNLKQKKNSYITIAGAKIDCDYTIVAHSDGDVVYHAIADALSSVLLHKSIGEIFSDRDDANKGRDSAEFVKTIHEMTSFAKIGNVDIIVILETPSIFSHTEEMRKNIAKILNIDPDNVSIRGKRREDDIKKISAITSMTIIQ